ncbi:MAG TPA: class I SAM-dependent methyltransferase [Vicinamibacteria bacterium]|nr:class I SAM-dependent methyltransferase [Vicinamibacteria bacterium]
MSQPAERDYVLGTHDEEIERLALQHRVWRPRVLDAWARAGFGGGQTLLDVGCGPGHATLDLAALAGPSGRVVAVDQSRRFLEALAQRAEGRGFTNIERREHDLDDPGFGDLQADGAWARWIFAFVRRPRELLTHVVQALAPGGVLVVHEYFDYRTWRLLPRSTDHEEFVSLVMESWREAGGEPDIALSVPAWLLELGLEIRELRPIVDVVAPTSPVWPWPRTFIEVGLKRLVELGRLSEARAGEIWRSFREREAGPGALMATPAVLEVIAVRPRRTP